MVSVHNKTNTAVAVEVLHSSAGLGTCICEYKVIINIMCTCLAEWKVGSEYQ